MKVAVPLFGEEVSPRFGCSSELLLARVCDGQVDVQEVTDISGLDPWEMPEHLRALKVGTVICGGVHPRFRNELDRHGIEVIWGVIGSAADALAALAEGTLSSDQFVCSSKRPGSGRGGFGGNGVARGRRRNLEEKREGLGGPAYGRKGRGKGRGGQLGDRAS